MRRDGVRVEKAADNIQLVVSLKSDGRLDDMQLGELAASNVLQALRRVDGVGKVQLWGAEAAMRIWPDPAKLTAMSLTPGDIVNAARAQRPRHHRRPGQPGRAGQRAAERQHRRHRNAADARAVRQHPLRAQPDGATLRLKDVARVELGGTDYMYLSRVNGQTATGLGIKLAPGSNAVDTTRKIRQTMTELAQYFPAGVTWDIPYETSTFVEISIKKVVTTLLEAIALVFCVMYLFMQNFRATLIPTLVVPVALLGTLGVMLGLGYSINVLTMFGMVLAIGILVDDAIVVVENVERIMAEEGLSPHDATVKAMGQISGAIIGITVVLVSVFVPMAFFDGAVGNIYRQFSVTLAVSIAFSAFLALSLTPALCATMLRPIPAGHHEKRGFFGWFNRAFVRLTAGYTARVAGVLSRPVRFGLAYAAVIAAVALFVRLPSSFLPEEDQGSFNAMVILPQGATQAETRKLVLEVENYMMKHEPVRFVYSVSGFSEYGSGPNSAMFFVTLKDWKERHGADMHVDAVVARVNKAFADHKNAMVLALNAPPLPELGSTSGFDFRLQGPRRPGLPGPDEGPPAAAGGRRRTSGAGRGHARRPGRSPAAATAHRPRQGPGHARVDGGNQHRAGGDVRLGLHRRLHAQRPGAPRDGAGRRQEPRRRGGRVAPARAQCAGPDGAHVGLRHAGLGHGTAAAEPLQRLPRVQDQRLGRARPAAARPCAPWNSWLRNCRAASASPGRASPTRKSCPATRPTCCSRCPSWWCSWRWPRCMKAGPFRWR